jgi:hypothetical protein
MELWGEGRGIDHAGPGAMLAGAVVDCCAACRAAGVCHWMVAGVVMHTRDLSSRAATAAPVALAGPPPAALNVQGGNSTRSLFPERLPRSGAGSRTGWRDVLFAREAARYRPNAIRTSLAACRSRARPLQDACQHATCQRCRSRTAATTSRGASPERSCCRRRASADATAGAPGRPRSPSAPAPRCGSTFPRHRPPFINPLRPQPRPLAARRGRPPAWVGGQPPPCVDSARDTLQGSETPHLSCGSRRAARGRSQQRHTAG